MPSEPAPDKTGAEQLLHDAVSRVVFHELHQPSTALHEGDYVLVPVLVNAVRSQVLPPEVVGFTGNLADLRRVEGLARAGGIRTCGSAGSGLS